MAAHRSKDASHIADIKAQIEEIWRTYADDPGERAYLAARLCMKEAPALADWVGYLVLSETPPCQKRDLALDRLSIACMWAEHDAEEAARAHEPRPSPFILPRPAWPPTPQEAPEDPPWTLEDLYKYIFGVTPVIVDKEAAKRLTWPETACFRVDPELGRLAVVVHQAAALRVWTVGRALTREDKGSGQISRKQLAVALAEEGIDYTQRHLRRLLAEGEGLFWNVDGERVFLRSPSFVSRQLTAYACKQHIGELEFNRPGVRDMYVPVEGSLEQWEAMLYAAWIGHREDLIISRAALSALFGRDKRTIRRWEKNRLKGIVRTRPNYVQCPDWQRFYDYIPPHAQVYIAMVHWRKRDIMVQRVRWQIANAYFVGPVRQHKHKGQASKVRGSVNDELDRPADERRGGWQRLYFDEAETLRKFARKYGECDPKYLWRGENRRDHGIFEINANGFPQTHATERVSPRLERVYLRAMQGRRRRN